MIIVNQNKRYKTYTLRRTHNGKVIAKFRTNPMSKEDFLKCAYFGTESWNKYIKDNNLKNIKK